MNLKLDGGEISVNPRAVCYVEDSPSAPGDPKRGGSFEPFCSVHFTNGDRRRVMGLRDTVKVLLELTP